MPTLLNFEQHQAYERDGYILIPGLFDKEEIGYLRTAMETDEQIRSHFYDRKDETGAPTKMALWNHPGDSAYGLAARSNRVVDTMEDILSGEVYHYHSKLTAKDAYEGGAWEWHQDYGYWYANGCLFPLMASVMIAFDYCPIFASGDLVNQKSDDLSAARTAVGQVTNEHQRGVVAAVVLNPC